jgi:hypothetical protein
MTTATTHALAVGGRHVTAEFVHRPQDLWIDGRAVVINPNATAGLLGGPPARPLPAFSSTNLVDGLVRYADSVLVLRVDEGQAIAGIRGEPGWHRLADLVAPEQGEPLNTELWRGPQADIGVVRFDPGAVLDGRPTGPRSFTLRTNLWFAPAGTDCGIHRLHDFVEIHTQVSGTGRMQKFTAPDHTMLYEDVIMPPGYTTPVPFCGLGTDDRFVYPWHQYRADTDCVWLALEYHMESGQEGG